MTQEMGESLMYSWLRHVKGCQIVQMNWKVSPTWIPSSSNAVEDINRFINDFKNDNNFKELGLFGNSNDNQIIYQAECDILGYNGDKKLFAVESAYHKGNLRYKSGNTKKIVEKLIKNAMCIYAFWGKSVAANLIFATPKCPDNDKKIILKKCDSMNNWAKKNNLNYSFGFICNDDYNKRIIGPVLLLSGLVNDSSEMFLRSAQLLQLAGFKLRHEKVEEALKEFGKEGIIANIILRSVLSNTNKNINKLISNNKKIGKDYPLSEKEIKVNNHYRTYITPIIKGKKKYYLYNGWTKDNSDSLIEHINNFIE